jgi:hypothetical protein
MDLPGIAHRRPKRVEFYFTAVHRSNGVDISGAPTKERDLAGVMTRLSRDRFSRSPRNFSGEASSWL